jgi:hypothetical protein
LFLWTSREGIEDHDYPAEYKSIFEFPDNVTPNLIPQKAWLLADVLGHCTVRRGGG